MLLLTKLFAALLLLMFVWCLSFPCDFTINEGTIGLWDGSKITRELCYVVGVEVYPEKKFPENNCSLYATRNS